MSKIAIDPDNYVVLSDETIKQLKRANQVNFYFEPRLHYSRSEMTIYPNSDHKEYFKTDTKTLVEGTWQPHTSWVKFWGSTNHYCYEFKTFTNYLRKGDMIRLVYSPDHGTNGYVRAAGLHCDYLYVEVVRGDKLSRFILDISVCPNNSARMCQPNETRKEHDRKEMERERLDFHHWYDMGLDRPKTEAV